MNLLVVRHGETDWNKIDRSMGRTDIPLNQTGKEQAITTKVKLENVPVDLIICSPLIRAKETANIIKGDRNIEIVYDQRLIERDMGEFEGMKSDINGKEQFWDYYANVKYERAENIQDMFKRVYELLDDIKSLYKNKSILLVTHGGVAVAINCYCNNRIPEDLKAAMLRNAEVAHYQIDVVPASIAPIIEETLKENITEIKEELKKVMTTEDKTNEFKEEDIKKNKGMAMLSYILPPIPYFTKKDSEFVKYHSKIGMNLFAVEIIYVVLFIVLTSVIKETISCSYTGREFDLYCRKTPELLLLFLSLIAIIIVAFIILGIINAIKGKAKELPFIDRIKIFK